MREQPGVSVQARLDVLCCGYVPPAAASCGDDDDEDATYCEGGLDCNAARARATLRRCAAICALKRQLSLSPSHNFCFLLPPAPPNPSCFDPSLLPSHFARVIFASLPLLSAFAAVKCSLIAFATMPARSFGSVSSYQEI